MTVSCSYQEQMLRRLLEADSPHLEPADLQHVAGCPSCDRAYRQFRAMEDGFANHKGLIGTQFSNLPLSSELLKEMTPNPAMGRPWWKAPALTIGITGVLLISLLAVRLARPPTQPPSGNTLVTPSHSRPNVVQGALLLDGRATLASGTRLGKGTFSFVAQENAELAWLDGTRITLKEGTEGLIGNGLTRIQRGEVSVSCETSKEPMILTTPRGNLRSRQARFLCKADPEGRVHIEVQSGLIEILKPSGQVERSLRANESWDWPPPQPGMGSDSREPLPGGVMDSPVREVDPKFAP